MKKVSIAVVLCLSMGLGLSNQQTSAEESPGNTSSDGKTLAARSKTAFEALSTGDYDGVWNCLSPARQGGVSLQKECMHDKLALLDLDKPAWTAQFQKGFDQLDPQHKLHLKSPYDLLELSDEQFLGLACGLLAMGDYLAKEPVAKWYLVEQLTGLAELRLGKGARRTNMLGWTGTSIYKTASDARITLQFTQDEGDWKLDDFQFEFGKFKVRFAEFLEQGAEYDIPLDLLPAKLLPIEEGLQVLRDRARIDYSKTGTAPTALSNCGVEEHERRIGKYTVRDSVYSSDMEGAVVADPNEAGMPWILCRFAWDTGRTAFESFENKDAVDARVAELFDD